MHGDRLVPSAISWRLLQPSNPIPQRSEIFIAERQCPNILIKLDRIAKALLGVLHATGDTGVAGEIESNQGTLGVQLTRFEKNSLRRASIFSARRTP